MNKLIAILLITFIGLFGYAIFQESRVREAVDYIDISSDTMAVEIDGLNKRLDEVEDSLKGYIGLIKIVADNEERLLETMQTLGNSYSELYWITRGIDIHEDALTEDL